MVFLFSFAALFLATNVQAAVSEQTLASALLSQSQSTCGNFIRHDEQRMFFGYGAYGFGFGKSRDPHPSRFRTVDLETHAARDYATLDSVVDAVGFDSTAYILTYTSIEEWNLLAHQRVDHYPTHTYNRDLGRNDHAVAMAAYGQYLVIAHGRRGVSLFDTYTKTIVADLRLAQDRAPIESKATSIAVHGDYAFVTMDGHHLTRPPQPVPFSGIVVIDLRTFEVVSELDGMDMGSDAVSVDEDFVVVSFSGRPIWKYDRKALLVAKKLPLPLEYIWLYPFKGAPTRKPLMTENLYLTCYLTPPAPGTGKLYKSVPMVLERNQIKLGR